jgi:hypothetical protein
VYKKNSACAVRVILICAAAPFFFLGDFAFCQEVSSSSRQGLTVSFQNGLKKCINFLKEPDFYNKAIRYIQQERRVVTAFQPGWGEWIILLIIDLPLSLLCLWLALYLVTGLKIFPYKKYLWFLFVLNLGWFVSLLIFRVVWTILYFMVIRLEPALYGVILDNLTLAVILSAVFVYIWLSARTFGLNFLNSLRTLLISHLLYVVAILAFFFFVGFLQADWLKLAKEELGWNPMFRSYIADVSKITNKLNVLSLLRFRAFHL